MATISTSCEECADSPFTKSECEPIQYVSIKRYFRTVHRNFKIKPLKNGHLSFAGLHFSRTSRRRQGAKKGNKEKLW